MNQETVAWLAVALLSISALGVSATTLESSVSTDANDVIDLEYDRVPIGQDTASNALDEIEGRQRDGESATSANPDEHRQAQSASSQPDQSNPEQQDAQQAQDSQSQSQQQERSESEDASGGLEPMSLLDRILALLTSLLQPLLALAALIAVVGLAVRYRDRLLGLLEDPESDDGDGRPAPDGSDRWFEGSPAHAIEGAWLGMVRRLDVEEPETMTTSECANAAIEAGLDREAVRRLTETYEEVRYGDQPVTEHREQVARQSQRRLELGGGT